MKGCLPELPGCAADGPTMSTALAAEWIETGKSPSRPVPAPHGRLMYA